MTPTRAAVCLLAVALGVLAAEIQAALMSEPTDVDYGPDDALPSWLVASPW